MRCRRRDWLLTRCPFRIHHPSRKGTSNSCTHYHSATPAYKFNVPQTGIEPVLTFTVNEILSLARLPISPPGLYRSLAWNRTTNNCLEGSSYIHLTTRPVADGTGLEPATFGVTSRHSNQLNYPSKFEPSDGIEPPTY